MRPKKNNHIVLKVILILIMLLFIAGTVYTVKLCLDLPGQAVETRPTTGIQLPTGNRESEPTETTAPPETTLPELPGRITLTGRKRQKQCLRNELTIRKLKPHFPNS